MGFGVWEVYGLCYAFPLHFPANQLGGRKMLWGLRGYGFSDVWVKRGSTVHITLPFTQEQKDLQKKKFELKGGPVNDMQLFMFDTSRCVEHRYNQHTKKEEYINMSTVHRMCRFTSLCVADPIRGVCCYSYTLELDYRMV